MAPMTIEIWSDVVCPWCYVGKRRLEHALERFPHRDDVQLTWRSFQLDPSAPPERKHSSAEYLASKYGMSVEQAEKTNAEMTEMAAGEGLEYHLDRTRGGNSFDAHRLIHLAGAHGRQDAMKERLMRAYFTEGEPVGNKETLVRLATDIGLDEAEARTAIQGEAYADAVHADEELAARIGIRGVPFFVLDRRYGVSGAQPAELLLDALDKAWEERADAA